MLLMAMAIGGCNLLTPLIFVGAHKKTVAPEFDKLAGKRVAVLVWVDETTLFDYPFARFELASYVSDKLYSETSQRKMNVDVVDPRDVEDYLERNTPARVDPRSVGGEFEADYVVYLEVLEFQMRDPTQPQLLWGKIEASVNVHDIHADADRLQAYELAPVRCAYPESGPVLLTSTNAPVVREAVYQKFAEEVARKFYEHSVEL